MKVEVEGGGLGINTVGTINSQVKSANGAVIASGEIVMQTADGTSPGLVSTGAQTIAGNKTFSGTIGASNLSGTNTGDVTLAAVGSSANANGASLSGQQLTLQPASASFPGVVTTGAQTIAGAKVFSTSVQTPQINDNNGIKCFDLTNRWLWDGGGGSVIADFSSAYFTLFTGAQFWSGDLAKNVKLRGPATGSTDYTYYLPNAQASGASALVNDGAGTGSWLAYTNANTASTLVQRDSSGNFSAGTVTATGVNVSGLTASQAVVTDGSKNLASLQYTNSNTASTLVQRDASGNFAAGTITASVTGTASGNTTISGQTNHGVVVASSTNAMTSTGAGTAGQPLVSGGASADPSFATLGISGGGTNNASLAVTAGGTLYTDGTKLMNVGAGTSGQVLQSAGSSAPAWGPTLASWTSFTPTGSWSSNVTYTGFYKRVGDTAYFRVHIACSGAPTSAALTIDLPAAASTIDTAKLPSGYAQYNGVLGTALIRDAGANIYPGVVFYNSTTTVGVAVGYNTVTSNSQVTQAVPMTFGASDGVSAEFALPISGWT